MGEQGTNPGDAAESKMGDAGKGSFQQSQDKDQASADADRAKAAPPAEEHRSDGPASQRG